MVKRRTSTDVENVPEEEVELPPVLSTARQVDTRPTLTARQMFRGGNNPLTHAFLHVEGLAGRTRKLPREDWEAEFKKFCESERR